MIFYRIGRRVVRATILLVETRVAYVLEPRQVGRLSGRLKILQIGWHEYGFDRQHVFRGEFEVAGVMRRATEDSAGAIVHQDEVGDPDRHFPRRVQRMLHPDASVKAYFVCRFNIFRRRATLAAPGRELGQPRITLQRLGQGMVGRDGGKGRAHQRIGAGRVNLQRLKPSWSTHGVKGELQALALADPVGLHQADLLGPVLQTVQSRQQFTRIVADLEKPLRQLAPFDQSVGAPAATVDDLFIGQNRHVDRVPVHHGLLAVDEARSHHVDEHRLLLAVILRVTGGEFPAPVDRQPQWLHLRPHVGDVAIGPVARVATPLHRGILGGHAESVPAHRVQDRVTLRRLGPRHHIAHRIVAHMAHVDAARRVGEHLKHVILGLGRVASRLKDQGLIPGLLPFRFDHGGFVARHLWPMR